MQPGYALFVFKSSNRSAHFIFCSLLIDVTNLIVLKKKRTRKTPKGKEMIKYIPYLTSKAQCQDQSQPPSPPRLDTTSRMCIHVCICVCVYVCIFVCLYVCMCHYLYVYMCEHVHARMCACMHACIFLCTYVCMYARMHICMYAWMNICMHVYIPSANLFYMGEAYVPPHPPSPILTKNRKYWVLRHETLYECWTTLKFYFKPICSMMTS